MVAIPSEYREKEERVVNLAAGHDLPHAGMKRCSFIAVRETMVV